VILARGLPAKSFGVSNGTVDRRLKSKPSSCRNHHTERNEKLDGVHDHPIALVVGELERTGSIDHLPG
jgi:hypothetical protein